MSRSRYRHSCKTCRRFRLFARGINAELQGEEKRRSAAVLQTRVKRPALTEEAVAVLADALEERGRLGAARAFRQMAVADDGDLPPCRVPVAHL